MFLNTYKEELKSMILKPNTPSRLEKLHILPLMMVYGLVDILIELKNENGHSTLIILRIQHWTHQITDQPKLKHFYCKILVLLNTST